MARWKRSNMEMTHGSLFTGIGGFDLGFERAGFQTIFQVEIDEYATQILAKQWPHVRRFQDIRSIDWRLVPIPTVLTGGFPCQDISSAGKRAGIAGRRSGLWVEFRRAIAALRPPFIIVENVSALYGRGLGTVLRDLAACGYDAEWDCLPAAAFGAPHLRERIFIVGYANGGETTRLFHTVHTGQSVIGAHGENAADSTSEKRRQSQAWHRRKVLTGRGQETRPAVWWAVEPNVGRVAHGVSARVDRLRGLGNAVVPQVAEFIAHAIRRVINGAV